MVASKHALWRWRKEEDMNLVVCKEIDNYVGSRLAYLQPG
jgi:hypothetical protein